MVMKKAIVPSILYLVLTDHCSAVVVLPNQYTRTEVRGESYHGFCIEQRLT